MTGPAGISRRTALAWLVRGVAAMGALGGSTACAPGAAQPPAPPPGDGLRWQRVDLGFVSAYVVVRGGEAAVVDTGVAGSEGAIAEALAAVDLGWGDVGHVLLTHRHADHAGSVAAVLDAAPDAAVYAGEDDVAAIRSPRPLTPLRDGDAVFDLRVIATPGHTPGHVSFLDAASGVLLVGDALNGQGDGRVIGPNPRYTADLVMAEASVAVIAELDADVLLFGHGNPVEGGAAPLVRALAG